MELYSFNKIEMQNNYNKILDLFYEADTIEKKMELYGQLTVLSDYLKTGKPAVNIENKKIKEYYKEKRKEQINELKNIESLTSDLCYFWCNSLRKINQDNKMILQKNSLNKEEYYSELRLFFESVMSSDIDLFKKTFEEQKILVKKGLLLSRGEMIYLESIKEYYIKMLYHGKLNKIFARNTIHEFGHVSEFKKTDIGRCKDHLMEEVIATVYELLYIDFCFPKDEKAKLLEISNLFKIIRLSSLEFFLFQRNSNHKYLNEMFFTEINYMYTDIIAMSIYLMKNEPNFHEKLSYIKENTPYIRTFELLNNIGINEDVLLDNSKNVKKLILERG